MREHSENRLCTLRSIGSVSSRCASSVTPSAPDDYTDAARFRDVSRRKPEVVYTFDPHWERHEQHLHPIHRTGRAERLAIGYRQSEYLSAAMTGCPSAERKFERWQTALDTYNRVMTERYPTGSQRGAYAEGV